MEKGGTTMAFKYLYTSASAFPIRPVSKPLWAGASIIPAKRGCCLHGREREMSCFITSIESSRRTDSDWKEGSRSVGAAVRAAVVGEQQSVIRAAAIGLCWLDTELANRQRKKCGC
jgi:hypothetical protein